MVSQLINDNGNPAANHFVIKSDKAVYFQSYKSVICKLDGINVIISRNWDYSNTTRKHLYIFFRQQGFYNLSCAKDVRNAIKKVGLSLKMLQVLTLIKLKNLVV